MDADTPPPICSRLIFALLLAVLVTTLEAQYTPPQVDGGCVVRSYVLRSDVHLRYATTILKVRVLNPSRRRAAPANFSVMVPDTALISGFVIEMGEELLQTSVTTLNEDTPTHSPPLEINDSRPRDTKLFHASISLPPKQEAIFYLTYEQLLTRRLGIYELVLNLQPGQVVSEMRVEAYIYEDKEFAVLRVPGLRTGHEIDPLEHQAEFPLASIKRPTRHEAHVTFTPTTEQQMQIANTRGRKTGSEEEQETGQKGMEGQLVVQFELVRPRDGEVTVHDGFFVHNFCPTAINVLPKHAVFVLDLSSSMEGQKIEQLKLAMVAILDEMRRGDFFSIVQFNSLKSVWNPFRRDKRTKQKGGGRVVPVKPRYIAKAKKYIRKLKAMGGTDIQRALVKALEVAHSATSPLSLVVLLTDGESTVGETEPSRIMQVVSNANKNSSNSRQVPIYSLAFGSEADFPFLQRLSAENGGQARRIYDADDAAIQLHEVYAELSSPVLVDVNFNYPENLVDLDSLTQHSFHAAFSGSELVVAGKLFSSIEGETDMWGEVAGQSSAGSLATLHLPPATSTVRSISPPLPRVWAYLALQQFFMLESPDDSSVEYIDEATDLAIEYSFVVPTTTLTMQPPEGSQMDVDEMVTIILPSEKRSREEPSGEACSEGVGEDCCWTPLQQAYISCGQSNDRSENRKKSTTTSTTSTTSSTTPPPPPRQRVRPSAARMPENYPLSKQDASLDADIDTDSSDEINDVFQLVKMDQLGWLRDVRYGQRYLVLPKGRGGADQLFSLGIDEPNEPNSPCLSPIGETSHCRHLQYCPLQEFANNYHYFLHFFCPIQGQRSSSLSFAGVCCPDSVFEDTTINNY